MPLLSRCSRRSRRWLFAALVALPATPAGAADKIAIRFEVFGLAGLHVATDRTLIEESGNIYAITGDLKTTGLAGLFQDFQKKSGTRVKTRAFAPLFEPQKPICYQNCYQTVPVSDLPDSARSRRSASSSVPVSIT